MINNHYLFFTEYYKGIESVHISYDSKTNSLKADTKLLDQTIKDSKRNETLCRMSVNPEDIVPAVSGSRSIMLHTVYPGLLAGTGYTHQAFSSEEGIKLGFSLDYVTGQPYIPSSTVKGILRSAFSHHEFVAALLGAVGAMSEHNSKNFTKEACGDLCEKLFGSRPDMSRQTDNAPGVGQRDVFLDGVIGKKSDKILGLDYITPHVTYTPVKGADGNIKRKETEREIENMRGLKSPQPIRMLRVLPNVYFRFDFLLRGSMEFDGGCLDEENRLRFYSLILQNLGVGAKTNVGYGILEE